MTQQELTTIVEAVISALLTSGKTLVQLTTVTEIDENDYLELDGGRKVSFATLRDVIISSAGVTGDVVDYDDRDEVTMFSFNADNGKITLKQRGRTSKTADIPLATTTKRGLMSAADLSKLNYAYGQVLNDIPAALDGKVSNDAFVSAYENDLVKKTPSKYRAVPVEEGFVTLMSMGSALDNIDGGSWTYTHAQGDCWWDPDNNKVCYWTNGAAGHSRYNPSEEVLYYNSHTGRVYRWTGSAMQEEFVHLDSTGRVPESLLQPSVLQSMGDAIDNAGNSGNIAYVYRPVAGDYYFSNGSIMYYGAGGAVSLGAPSKTRIFCNAHTNKLYRWNGTQFLQLG